MQAPAFTLPSAQGPDVTLEHYRDRHSVLVWFTKGLACPFCRQQMHTLARDAQHIRGLGAEILQVTLTPVERARIYARRFSLPFPYLCDPDRRVRHAWGLGSRGHSTRHFLRRQARPTGPDAFSAVAPTPGELLTTIQEDDAGIFIVDHGGVIRYARSGSYYRRAGYQLPSYTDLRSVLSESLER